jgi:hypothetical protein
MSVAVAYMGVAISNAVQVLVVAMDSTSCRQIWGYQMIGRLLTLEITIELHFLEIREGFIRYKKLGTKRISSTLYFADLEVHWTLWGSKQNEATWQSGEMQMVVIPISYLDALD